MSGVLDIQDRTVNHRLLYFFENMEISFSEDQAGTRYPVEKWISRRVVLENPATEEERRAISQNFDDY